MTKINLIGDIFGTTGYVSHTKQLFKALYDEGADMSLKTQLPQGWEVMVTDAEKNALSTPKHKDGNTIFIGMPHFWKMELTDKGPDEKFYGFLIWEGDKIPKSFIEDLLDERVDGVFVASQHTANAILNTIKTFYANEKCEMLYEHTELTKKIHIIPHGVDLDIFKPTPIKHDNFTFLCNKGYRGGMDRGGIQFALRAYMEEFNKDEDVDIIFKINPAYGVGALQQTIQEYKHELGDNHSDIKLNDMNIPYKDLNKMYNIGDVFLSPTMSEAFNIPCAEAMACGLPVITTDFGGQTDFVNECNGWIVPTEPVEVDWDQMYEGVSWGQVQMDELKKTMRYCYDNQDEVKKKGTQALRDIHSFTWLDSAKKLIEVLE